MKRTLLRAVTVAACTLALAAPIGAAQAETQSHQDPRGDVAKLSKAPGGREPGVDIRKVVNTFEGSTLTMRVKVPNHARSYIAGFNISAGHGDYFGVDVQRQGEFGAVNFYGYSGNSKNAQRTRLECDGLGFEARKANIVVTLDRSCIDDTNHARIGTSTIRIKRNRLQIDDAWRGAKFNPERESPKYGPRLNLN